MCRTMIWEGLRTELRQFLRSAHQAWNVRGGDVVVATSHGDEALVHVPHPVVRAWWPDRPVLVVGPGFWAAPVAGTDRYSLDLQAVCPPPGRFLVHVVRRVRPAVFVAALSRLLPEAREVAVVGVDASGHAAALALAGMPSVRHHGPDDGSMLPFRGSALVRCLAHVAANDLLGAVVAGRGAEVVVLDAHEERMVERSLRRYKRRHPFRYEPNPTACVVRRVMRYRALRRCREHAAAARERAP